MRMRLKKFLPLMILPILAACGNVLEGYSPPPEIAAITETIVEKSFDETWRGLQFVAADNFFHIRELDQDAGTMVLRFDSKAPGIPPVFDCGTFWDRPSSYRGPDVIFELAINVTRVQESHTRVNLRTTYRPKNAPANLQYDLQLSDLQYLGWLLVLPFALVTTAGSRTTCHPTRLAERAIVDGIAKENVLGPASSDVAAKLAGWANQYRHREWSQFFFDESLLMYAQILGTDQTEVDLLLLKYADYARQHGKPADAETLSQRILEVQEKAFGRDHPSLVPTLNALASLYGDGDRYDKAEALRLRVLAISERAFGVGHSEVGLALDGLVALYREQGKLAEVEGQYKRAVRLREAALGLGHSGLVPVLAPLADLYDEEQRFVEAYPIHLRVLTISNDLYAPNDKKVVSAFDRLVASDSQRINSSSEETQLKRALEIAEVVLGIVHPVTDRTLGKLEKLYRDEGRFVEAEKQYMRALASREQAFGVTHPSASRVVNRLEKLYSDQGDEAKIVALFERAVVVRERSLGLDHADLAPVLDRLGAFYLEQQRYPAAEATFLRALAIRGKVFEAPDILLALKSIVALYSDRGAFTEAKSLRRRVLEIYERAFAKTEGQYKRELADKEETLGSEHIGVAEVLSKLADFYHAQGRLDEEESTYKRKLALHEKASRRAGVGESLEDLAKLYTDQGRQALAEEFRNRSWELSSPYCYRPGRNKMTMVGPKWTDCSSGEVFASRSEYAEWKASKQDYREKFRQRETAQ